MAATKAALLGLIQGITEFLPVSSSGHLVLGQRLLGITQPELLFDIILHLATLLAVLAYFRQDLKSLLMEFFNLPKVIKGNPGLVRAWQERPEFKLMGLIVIASAPTAVIGFAFKDLFESLFASTMAVGLALLITGTILFSTKFVRPRERSIKQFTALDAIMIGLAQGLAITPGLSRAGLTISAGLLLGLNRDLVGRFSFLIFIPAILGALVLEATSLSVSSFTLLDSAVGFVTALLAGIVALHFLLKIVRKGAIHYFSYYCWLAGLVAIALSL